MSMRPPDEGAATPPLDKAFRPVAEEPRRNGLTVVLSFVAQAFVKEPVLSARVHEVVEIVGSSTIGTENAIRNAIETSIKTIRHISWSAGDD